MVITAHTSRYLVVEPISIVAMDLEAGILDCDPGADVIVVATLDGAASALRDRGAIQFAFLHSDAATVAKHPLSETLAAHRAICVYMGTAAEAQGGAHYVLEWPFSAATVTDLMVRIGSRNRACA